MDFPNCVNYSVKLDGNGRVLEKSMLINVRGSELSTVIATFNSMRGRLNGDLAGATLPKLPDARPQVALAEPEENHNDYPGPCPRCGGGLLLKTARKGARAGLRFWACSAYQSSGCLHTQPA